MRKKSLTLVEMVVVVAILAIIMSMVLAGMARSKQIAYRTACLSNLTQFALMQEDYTVKRKDQGYL